MRPGARAAGAIEILDAIEDDRSRPADRLIANWFHGRRYAGAGDRRAIRDLVYTELRRRLLESPQRFSPTEYATVETTREFGNSDRNFTTA